jgi:hypothetical protein
MADQYTPEEIANIFEAYNNAIKTGTPITQEMADAMKDAQKGIKGYAAAQKNLFAALGKSVADITKAMYKGEQGAAGLAGSVETVTTALTTLSFLIGGPLVKAISLVTMGLFKLGKVSAEQSDQLFKTYQDLAKTGAGAADGMKGVFDNMQKFGYGLEQLDQMTALIRENSKALSTFGGTVLGGTKIFAENMAGIQRSDLGRQFQRMGYTVDDINKYGAGYVKLQQMLGRSQTDIQQGLTAGTTKYMMELDKLARITGDTREAQEAKIAEAMAEDTFAATMDELREQAAAGDASAEARMNKLNILNQTLTGEARQEFIKAIGGDVAAAQKLMMTAPKAYQMMLDSSSSAGDVMSTLVQEEKNTRQAFRGLYKLGAAGDTFFRYAEGQDRAAKFGEKNLDQQLDQAAAEQKVTDQTTKNAADLRISQQQARDALQSFVNIGVAPATAALKGLTGAIAGGAKMAPGTVGTGQPMGGGGGAGPTSAVPAGDVDQILATIRRRESGGNYAAQAKGSTASGAYQFIDSTWQSMTKKFGMGEEFKSAKMAPKEIQDAVAKAYVQDILKRAGGDVSKVPLEWYTGNIQGKISDKALAANQGLTPEMYQQKWLADYSKAGPTGGYNNKMSSVRPGSSLPTAGATDAAADRGTANDEIMAMMRATLVSLDRKMGDVADNTKKSANYAGA